jgi:hypothetical protein
VPAAPLPSACKACPVETSPLATTAEPSVPLLGQPAAESASLIALQDLFEKYGDPNVPRKILKVKA